MNKQQLCLVLDQIDPRYIDEATAYRGRSPKRAARTLLIAAVILLLGALFTVGTFSFFRSEHLPSGSYIRPELSGKRFTLNDGTALNLTYDHTEKNALGEITDIYLHEKDEYTFINERLTGYSGIYSAQRLETDNELMISREEAIRIAEDHLALYYNLPEGYRFLDCSYYEAGMHEYIVTYALSFGEELPVTADWVTVAVSRVGAIIYSVGPRPHRYEGFDPSSLKGITEKTLEAYVKDQIVVQYGENSCIACDLIEAYLRKSEEGSVQLIAYTYVNIRGQGPTELEFVYPLDSITPR